MKQPDNLPKRYAYFLAITSALGAVGLGIGFIIYLTTP